MRDRERGDDDDERPQPPERDHEAQQEQQVVDALEDVPEARDDEAQRRLVPARIELARGRDRRGTRRRASAPPGGRKRSAVVTRCAEAVDARMDRRTRSGRSGSDIRAARRAAAGSSRGRGRPRARGPSRCARACLVGGERAVRRQRHARVRRCAAPAAARRPRRPRCCRSARASRRCAAPVGAREVEIAGAAGREVDVAAWRPAARARGARAAARPA